jgi:hypothetical protein
MRANALIDMRDAQDCAVLDLPGASRRADRGAPKLSEFDAFASGRPEIGQNHPSAKLYAQTPPARRCHGSIGPDFGGGEPVRGAVPLPPRRRGANDLPRRGPRDGQVAKSEVWTPT